MPFSDEKLVWSIAAFETLCIVLALFSTTYWVSVPAFILTGLCTTYLVWEAKTRQSYQLWLDEDRPVGEK